MKYLLNHKRTYSPWPMNFTQILEVFNFAVKYMKNWISACGERGTYFLIQLMSKLRALNFTCAIEQFVLEF